jgi:transposase-like protein
VSAGATAAGGRSPSRLTCPTCESDALYRYGFSKGGRQRFLCLLCGRQFVPHAPATVPLRGRPACPLCGSATHIYRREPECIRLRCSLYPGCRGYHKVALPSASSDSTRR